MICCFADGIKLFRAVKAKTDHNILREEETGRLNSMLINAEQCTWGKQH